MHFDPAIAAQQAFRRSEQDGELGEFQHNIVEAEETFSSDAGSEAKQAYDHLQQLGEQLPEAQAFQEFLIYITWQQVTEETIPKHFRKGAELCDRFLQRFERELEGSVTLNQIVALRESFRSGLHGQEAAIPEYDEDAFHGGD